jgi:hypothetical protein
VERVVEKIFLCVECKKEFKSRASLHKHLKQHGLSLAEYYTIHYPRENKLTGEPLPFKKFEEYFERDFSTRQQLKKWCQQAPSDEVGDYVLSLIEKREFKKKRGYAPFHLEVQSCFLPDIDVFRKIFGSYNAAAKKIGLRPLYSKKLPRDFFTKDLPADLRIAIDTREQTPLTFSHETCEHKLDVGDYTLLGDAYSYTYVDRKSGSDLQSTLSNKNYERFKRELGRARDLDSYLFVVVESTPQKMIKANRAFKRVGSIDFVLKRVRDLSYEFAGHCQFVFTGSRKFSQEVIPRILYAGKAVWETDIQYFLDHELDQRNTE